MPTSALSKIVRGNFSVGSAPIPPGFRWVVVPWYSIPGKVGLPCGLRADDGRLAQSIAEAGFGEGVVDDKAHIWLVDPHPKGDGYLILDEGQEGADNQSNTFTSQGWWYAGPEGLVSLIGRRRMGAVS
ncbi:MAG: hypothetical protein FRX49_09740 [Trebouxia sp. A1-2]|nr:MAG: hypothetical protein FRX49_09740 [Trebouxia sp. A1-2]